jgi:hypothetical protein
MTLLNKAKGFKSKIITKVTDEDIELALAWLRNEINSIQVFIAYDRKPGSAMMYRIASSLKAAYQKGSIKITNKI